MLNQVYSQLFIADVPVSVFVGISVICFDNT